MACTALRMGLIAAGVVIGIQSGCGSLEDIDARAKRLMEERTGGINGGAVPPTLRPITRADNEDSPRLTRTDLPTVNPAPEQIRYQPLTKSPAEEAAELEQRLKASEHPQTGPDVIVLDLEAALRQSQTTAREFLRAEEDYILAAIRLLVERHLWGPRFFDDVSAVFDSAQVDGDTTSALRVVNELRVTQRLPYGGEAAARWIWQATENLRSSATGQYVQASRLVFDASIPLLRGAGDVAREDIIQAERSLIYAARDFEEFRRLFLVQIAQDYFALVQGQATIDNTRRQLQSVRAQQEEQKALFQAGRVAEFDVNRAANQVLSAAAQLDSQIEQYILAVDRFKIRLGMPVEAKVSIASPKEEELPIPIPAATTEEAVGTALAYRLDLQNRRDQLDDSARQVRNARNRLLPDLNLAGSLTLPTDADAREGGVVYELDDVAYSAALTFSLPLDREIERLALRQTLIAFEQAKRAYEQFRDEVVVNVRFQRREIDRARDALRLAEEQVVINERRQVEQELKRNLVTSRERLDTAQELLDSRNARDQARTDLRNAILQYLVATGQMRVARDGTFIRLPGMEAAPPAEAVPPPPEAPALEAPEGAEPTR